jgi:hypothetical protein
MKMLKRTLSLAAIALLLAACNGGYVAGGDGGPYLGIWGPYGDGDFFFGGRGYHHSYGLHHFYGHSFGVHHFAGSFHAGHVGGFHGGGFHGGGGHR